MVVCIGSVLLCMCFSRFLLLSWVRLCCMVMVEMFSSLMRV